MFTTLEVSRASVTWVRSLICQKRVEFYWFLTQDPPPSPPLKGLWSHFRKKIVHSLMKTSLQRPLLEDRQNLDFRGSPRLALKLPLGRSQDPSTWGSPVRQSRGLRASYVKSMSVRPSTVYRRSNVSYFRALGAQKHEH